MLKQKDIMDCLPLLASVLGNQYGVTVEIGGSEAYTDGKTIHLPALPLDSEPELITMIKGYTDHESAHIRETDFEILRKANLTPFSITCSTSLRIGVSKNAFRHGIRDAGKTSGI